MQTSIDWNEPSLSQGLMCYRNQEFFEAHEHWETAWGHAHGTEKAFLQALIQITVALHHWHQNNLPGAMSLLRRSLRRLETYPCEYGGVNVETLRTGIRAWLQALDAADATYPPVPVIR